MDFDERLNRLDDDFKYFSGKKAAPDAAAIDAFEAEIGFALDPGYRTFIATLGCAAAVAKEAVWPPAKAYEIRPRWQMEHGLELYGLIRGATPPPLDARARWAALRDRGLGAWVATFGVLGTSEQLCHDAARSFAWINGRGEIERVDGDFASLLDARLDVLQRDKDRFKGAAVTR